MKGITVSVKNHITTSHKQSGFLIFIFLLFPIGYHSSVKAQAFMRASMLGRGININSYLNSIQNAGSVRLSPYDESDFRLMDSLGFNHVRIPTGFCYWTDTVTSGFPVDSTIFLYLDTVIRFSLENHLSTIIDYHPQNGDDGRVLNSSRFAVHMERLVASWAQIAARYKEYPDDSVFYELYNEPGFVTLQDWNTLIKALVDTIRYYDSGKTIIIWAGIDGNPSAFASLGDTNIIATIHFYEPSLFTHQGATWTVTPHHTVGIPFPYDAASMPSLDPLDYGTIIENEYNHYSELGNVDTISATIAYLADQSQNLHIPLYVGEFGVSKEAPLDSKLLWINTVRTQLELHHIPWAHWAWKGANLQASFQMFDCYKCINPDSLIRSPLTGNSILCALGLDTTCNQPSANRKVTANNDAVTIYPVPAQSQLFILNSEDYDFYDIYTLTGRLIVSGIPGTYIPVASLQDGIYILCLKNRSTVKTFKFIIGKTR